ELDLTQWRSIFRQLVAGGYLEVDVDGFGALRLTEKCRPLLRGESELRLRRDVLPAKGKSGRASDRKAPEHLAPADEPLWNALRACRKRLAEQQGVPPYVIFHDATLRDMLQRRPMTLEDMAAVSGVGQSKLNRYGAAFLDALHSAG